MPKPHATVRRVREAVLGRARRSGHVEPTGTFLADLERACSVLEAPPTVVVLAPATGPDLSAVVSQAQPRARVSRLDPAMDPSALHAALAAAGPLDVLVDASPSGANRAALFRRTFFHVRARGSYLVYDVGLDAQGLRSGSVESILGFVARLLELRSRPGGPPRTRTGVDNLAVAQAIKRVWFGREHLVMVSRSSALPRLSEQEATAVLEARGPSWGRVLHRLEQTRFPSRASISHIPATRAQTSPRLTRETRTFDVPALSLREYSGVRCQPGQVAVSGHLILPDSYRKIFKARPRNKNLQDIATRFAVPKRPRRRVRELEGAYFYLDSEWRGHFGHAMSEQVSRLWGWPLAKEAEPGLKVLMSVNRKWGGLHEFERLLYGAAGIAEEDIVLIDGPVRVERLLAATPMFAQPEYVHPDIAQTWTGISRALAAQAPVRDYPRRIFCARRGVHRACRNADEVEALFTRFGFEIVFPERFSLPEQVMMFRSAEVVAGYSGSGVFNLCLTESAKRVVLVSSDGYSAKNEFLIASVLGHRMDVVWCNADLPMPEVAFVKSAYESPYSMDFEREGRELEALLASLA